MRTFYPHYRIAYSVKTNYMPYLCSLIHDCGGMAEVVSSVEYDLVRRMGFSAADIIFNGPFKRDALKKALLEGATVVVDNSVESAEILKVASDCPEALLHVGLRLNFDIGTEKASRFGFDVTSEELNDVIEGFYTVPNVAIDGIHCHFTGARDLQRWSSRVAFMLEFAQTHFDGKLRFIDLGSGMYGEMEPEFSHLFGSSLPSFEDYAAVVARAFADVYASVPDELRPVLITEPGTTIVANAIDSVAQVIGIKVIRGKTFIVLDTSYHVLGELSRVKNLPLQVLSSGHCASNDMVEDAAFVGYTCLEYDIVYRGYCGPIAIGDFVVFGNVGSYSMNMKPPFIYPGCAAVAYDDRSCEAFVVKRRETMDDFFATYRFDF